MNHIYRVVFNARLGLWQAVCEIARSAGGKSSGVAGVVQGAAAAVALRPARARLAPVALGVALVLASMAAPVWADGGSGPGGASGIGVGGKDQIDQAGGAGGAGQLGSSYNSGGGGGAGITGGAGGAGGTLDSAAVGGAGGASPGANGGNGADASGGGAPNFAGGGGGGGGGGGAHGLVGAALTQAVTGGAGGAGDGSVGGGGGGAGGYGAVLNSVSTSIGVAVTGGAGGAGGAGTGTTLAAGGGGGSGGVGLYLSNPVAVTVNQTVTVKGGNGGSGGAILGSPSYGYSGAGGAGGAGIQTSGGSITVNNGVTVQGGAGGAGGTLPSGVTGTAGSAGNGGAGILANGTQLTVAGTISGGLDGTGQLQAAAVQFVGGSNQLTLQTGAQLNGGIVVGGTSTAQATIGNDAGNTTALSASLSVASGSTATLSGALAPLTVNGVISGAGTLGVAGPSLITLLGSNSLTGAVSLSTDAKLQLGSGGTAGSLDNVSGISTALNSQLIINRSDAVSLSTTISGAGAVVQAGNGTTTLTNTGNSYSGGTSVAAGTLVAAATGALGSGTVTVDNTALQGATLQINSGVSVTPSTVAAVNLTNGGKLVNSGIVKSTTQSAVTATTGTGELQNEGSITGGANKVAVSFSAGGKVSNDGAQASITGGGSFIGGTGVVIDGGIGEVVNTAGASIKGTGIGGGVQLLAGGSVSNDASQISGSTLGVSISAVPGSVKNLNGGSIKATSTLGVGVSLDKGGIIENAAGSTIAGSTNLALAAGSIVSKGSTQLINGGTLTGSVNLSDVSDPSTTPNYTHQVTLQVGGKITGNLLMGSNTVSTLTLADSLAGGATQQLYSGAVTGSTTFAGALIKNGSTSWVMDKDLTAASTTIGAGMLQLGNGGAVGSVGSGAINIAQDAVLAVNRSDAVTLGQVIDGSGSLQQNGINTTTLTAANRYTGGTTITQGTLALSASGSLAGTGAVNLAGSGTTFDISGANSSQSVGALSGVAGSTVALGGNALTFGDGSNQTLAGKVTGTGVLIKTGSGTQTLTGANDYSGGTIINQGTLALGAGGRLASTGAVSLAGSGTTFDISAAGSQTVGALSGVAGSTVALGGNALIFGDNSNQTLAATVTGVGGSLTKNGAGTQTLTGANDYSGGTTINQGTLALGAGGSLASTGTVSLAGSGTTFDISAAGSQTVGALSGVAGSTVALGGNALTFGDNSNQALASTVSGTGGSLIKNGTGTTLLTGTNTYTGGTTVNGGKLLVGNATQGGSVAGNVQVNTGAALGGSGSIGGNVNIASGGTLSPGNSPGTLTIGGDLTLTAASGGNPGSTTVFELGQAGTVGGSSNDLIKVGGSVSLGGTLDATVASAGWYRLINYGTSGSGSVSGQFDSTALHSSSSFDASQASASVLTSVPNQVNLAVVGQNQSLQLWNGANGNTWDTNTVNWTNSDPASGITSGWQGSVAVFGTDTGATPGTVTVSGQQSFDTLQFSSSGYTVAAASSADGLLISPASSSNPQTGIINVDPGVSAEISAGIANGTASSLTLVGRGTLTLSGNNSYTGGTTVSNGTLVAASNSALGTGSVAVDGSTSALNVNSGISLSNAVTLSNEATLNNAGTLTATGTTVSGTGGSVTVNNSSGAIINPGAAGGTAINLQGSGTVNNAGSIGSSTANLGVSLQAGGSVGNQAGATISGGLASVQGTGGTAVTLRNAGTLVGDVQLDSRVANAVTLQEGSNLQGNLNMGTNTGSALVLDGAGSQSYASAVTGDTTLAGTLTKTGAGTWTLDKNLGSGFAPASTTIADGTLALSGAGTLGSSSSLNLSGSSASLDISAANAAQSVTTLAGAAGSQIHLGANNLSFGDSSNQSFAGSIDGSGGITKTGTGTQTLSGINSYTGTTTIGAGTLQLGDGTATGQGSVAGNIANNGALVINNLGAITLAGNISGTGTLTQQGQGTTTLTGTNNYSGDTTISAGVLQLGDGSAAGSGTVLGNVINNAALVVNNAGAVTVAGSISGAGTVTQQGAGTTTLASDNNYQGTTTISAGTLQVGTGGTTGTLSTGAVVNNGTLALDRSDTTTVANAISGSGALVQQGTGTTVLTGNNSYQGATTIAAGTLQVGAGGTSGNLGAGAVTNNGTLVLNRSDATTITNTISGTGALTQQGSGTTVLTGNTSYGGDTQINTGSLTFAGTSHTLGGNVNVAAGAGLSIASSAPVAVAGTVNLGNASTLSISSLATGTTGANLSASGVQLGSGVGLNLSGITSASQLDRVLISTTNGISGDFGAVTIGGFSGPVDYMTLNTGKSADGKQYLASYNLSWTANNSLAHGNFTLSNATDSFDVGVGLSNQAANAALGWDGQSLTKNGAGTLILSGSNSYTGSTTINGGTLQLGNGGTTGNLGTGTVINNGTLALDRSDTVTVANDISGTGGLLQQGTGTTVLAGNNTYQGGTAITGGTLQVDADARLGAASGGLSFNGGTLHTTASTTTQRQISLGVAGGSFSPDAGTALTVASAIQGTGGLTQAGAGSMVLTGNNSYQGTTTINSGTLQVGAGGTAGTLGAGAVTNNGTLVLNRSDAVAVANAISGAGSLVQQGTGTTALTGNNSYSGTTTIAAGTLQVGTGGTTGTLGTGAVTNNGVLSINRSDATTLAQSITGSGALQQTGTGTTTLTGTNSYTGGTVVAAGTLQAGSAGALVQNSSYYLNQGATLDLNGHALQTSMLMGSGNVLLGSGDLTVSNTAGQTDSFAGQIAGAGHLIKQGAGTLNLNGASSLTGGVNLKQGRINLGNAQGLGTGTLSMDDGTTLGLTANGMTIANNLVMTGTNDPVIDTGTNNATWAGAISGAGFLTKQGTGTLTLTSTANNYTGATQVAQGTLQAGASNTFSSSSAHTVATGATLDLAGYNQTLASLNNSGMVKLSSNGGGTPGTVLKVTGAYVGNGGTLGLSTVLAADGSATDKLLLSGSNAVASGSTTIQITNAGGLGAQTTGAGIQVVGTENGGSLQANSFTLAGGHVDAGAYEYRLFQTTQGATLQSTNTQLAYRSEVPLMSALPAQLRQADIAMLGDMHKRMGDDNVQASNGTGTTSADLGQNRRAWGRILRTDPAIRQQGTVSPESSGHMTGFQAGLDLYADQSVKAGIYVGQLDGDMSATGFAGGVNSKYVGFNTLRSRYLGVYGNWQDASGLYVDAVLQGADYRSQLHTAENTSANAATTKGSGWLASLEVGKPFAINSNWQIEPQAQLIYRKISLDDTALSLATVKNRADDDWTLRLGARIKGSFTTSAGVLQPYGRINVYKASSTTDVASFIAPAATTDIKAKSGYTATELAAGASLQLSKSTSVYGELGKLWANGGDSRVKSGVQASVGIKVLW